MGTSWQVIGTQRVCLPMVTELLLVPLMGGRSSGPRRMSKCGVAKLSTVLAETGLQMWPRRVTCNLALFQNRWEHYKIGQKFSAYPPPNISYAANHSTDMQSELFTVLTNSMEPFAGFLASTCGLSCSYPEATLCLVAIPSKFPPVTTLPLGQYWSIILYNVYLGHTKYFIFFLVCMCTDVEATGQPWVSLLRCLPPCFYLFYM